MNERMEVYLELCREMRAWPEKLTTRFKGEPPIGMHFFVWRELTQPKYYSLYDENRPRVEEPAWDEFQAANEGLAAKAIGGSEKWGRLPGNLGRYRFFAPVPPNRLDEIVDSIMEVLEQASETITHYQSFYRLLSDRPNLQWGLGHETQTSLAFSPAMGSPYLLSAMGILGFDYDEIDIFAQDEGDLSKFEPLDEEFIHRPFDGVRIAVDAYALQDFVSAFADAVQAWVPSDAKVAGGDKEENELAVRQKFIASGIAATAIGEKEDNQLAVRQPVLQATAGLVVQSVMVRKSVESICFEADDGRMITIPHGDGEWIIRFLLSPLARGLRDDFISWNNLNALMGEKTNRKSAADNLRSAYFRLNRRLRKWGQPPDSGDWIVVERGRGARLSQCKWRFERGLKRELARLTDSIYARQLDPHTAAENTPDYREDSDREE